MSGSKVVVKKPLRRYERAFEEEKTANEEIEGVEEAPAPLNPDITSSKAVKGTVMNSKKPPLRYKVKQVAPAGGKDEKPKEKGPGGDGEQAGPATP